jgi:hypothetical protein
MGNSSARNSLGLGLLGLGLTLGASLVVCAALLGKTFLEARSQHQTVEVKGYAERRILSDQASWQGGFTTRAPTLEVAYAKLAEQRDEVLAFLAEQGFEKESVKVSPVDTRVLYARNAKGVYTNDVDGYALTLRVRVESTDIDRVGALARDSSSLVERGIEFSGNNPEYFYTKLDELKISLLGDATADARRRAEVLAENSRARIGMLRSARQGVFQITPANSTEVSDYGRNDTSAREKSIKAVVTIRYALEG